MGDGNTNLLLEAIEKGWNEFQVRFKLYRHEASEESVHDLRVASRRLLSVIELLRGVAPHPRLQRLRKYLKDQLNSFDELHDTQVMIVEICEILEELPEAEPFLGYLEKHEKHLLRVAEKKADQLNLGNLKKRIRLIHKDLEKLVEKDEHLNNHLLRVVDDAYSLVLNRMEILDPGQIATIHRLRIAMKKFRYLVEIVYPQVEEYPIGTLELMHEFQNVMGDIHDIEILLTTMDEFYENQRHEQPESVVQFFQKTHLERIDTFYKNISCIKSFWRQTPAYPFPWDEKIAQASLEQKKSLPDASEIEPRATDNENQPTDQ
jgi:CHAD domain-containing protein